MSTKQIYKCKQCDSRREVPAEEQAPECCGQAMIAVAEPLGQCTLSSTAEHSRLDDTDEPCDDGRSGS